ncbi:MAG: PaaI family thioesterase [Dehalococcoidia bacterium]
MTFPGTDEPITPESMNARGEGRLPGLVGLEVTAIAEDEVSARIQLQPHHLAPNGYLHAAVVVALADTACGYGALRSRPEGSTGFTTIELKSNFLGTALEGAIACTARLVHGGRMTQVWDATVVSEGTGKVIALFRCTQMMLYPR